MTRKPMTIAELERTLLDAARKRPTTADVSAVTISRREGDVAAGDDWYVAGFDWAPSVPGADAAGVARELDDIAVLMRDAYTLEAPAPARPKGPLL